MHHPFCRKYRAERAAFAEFALNLQACLMTGENMLDDGQPQPGAAGFARAAAVDAVETFGEARDVLRFDADAGVLYAKHGFLVAQLPTQPDFAAFRRVADGVIDQIAEGAMQFILVAAQVNRGVDIFDQDLLAAACTQVLSFSLYRGEQRLNVNRGFLWQALTAFQL